MNKLHIGLTAISLFLGVANAFAAKAGFYATFWRTVRYQTMVRYAAAVALCPNGNYTCAIQYETISSLPTGYVLYRSLP